MNIGPTLKLVRMEQELSVSNIAQQLGVSRTTLNRFETTSSGMAIDIIDKYKSLLGIPSTITEEQRKEIKEIIAGIFDDLFYYNFEYRDKLRQLQNIQNILVQTEYYPLLYLLEFCVLVQDNLYFEEITSKKVKRKLDELTHMINLVEKSIPNTWLSLYFDYVGERNRYEYKYNQALEFYTLSEKNANDERHVTLLRYRMALAYTQMNKNSKALELIDKAKVTFDKYMNYERSLSAEFLRAMVYDNMCEYDEAIIIYERCLKVVKQGKYNLLKEQIYNNIIWASLMKGDYERALHVSERAIRLKLNKKAVYLYQTIAYYALDVNYKAKSSLSNCNNCIDDFVDPSFTVFFDLISAMIENDEKRINKIENEINYLENLSGADTVLFIYMMLIQYYKKKNDLNKVTTYVASAYQIKKVTRSDRVDK